MTTFNLLTEPWILAEDEAGGIRPYGLLEVLLQSPRLVGIVDASPPIQFGIYRLLIAFVIDALKLWELEDLADRLDEGEFDEAGLRRYIDQVGADRFDLFHPTYPFLQSAPSADDADRTASVARLFFHLPTGTNTMHFNHVSEDAHAIAPAVCARALCAVAPFMTAGGAGYSPSINGTPPWYVLVRGERLFQTLLLNCFALDSLGLDRDGSVPWRTPRSMVPKQEIGCDSLLEGLTWQPRQVRLLPGEGGDCTFTGVNSPVLVRQTVYGPGFKFAGGDGWTDPNAAYKTTDKGRLPLRPQEGRALWRDTGPLLLLRKEEYSSPKGKVTFSRPLVVEQFAYMRQNRFIPVEPNALLRVEVYGMRADKAKVFEWQYERMSLPASVAQAHNAGEQVQAALEKADSAAYALGKAMKAAYPREGKSNKKAFDSAIESLEQRYWDRLHQYFQERFLPDLAAQPDDDPSAPQSLMNQWLETLQKVGFQELDVALAPLDTGADALARQVAARESFARLVGVLLNPNPQRSASVKERRSRSR